MLIFRGLPGSPDPYVTISVFNPQTITLLEVIDAWSLFNKKIVNISSVDNGIHGGDGTKFTFHGLSLAWDFYPIGGLSTDKVSLAKYLEMRLPPPYQVIVETDHIHVEWDTGKGR